MPRKGKAFGGKVGKSGKGGRPATKKSISPAMISSLASSMGGGMGTSMPPMPMTGRSKPFKGSVVRKKK